MCDLADWQTAARWDPWGERTTTEAMSYLRPILASTYEYGVHTDYTITR